jgi:hypothetical protein
VSAYDADPAAVTVREQPPTYVEIARGPAGDCCLLCGKVGIDLPDEHGCTPTVDPAEVANRPCHRWADLFSSEGWSR